MDQHIFEKECIGVEEEPAKKLCLIAFLPNILDTKAAGRQAYIKASKCFQGITSDLSGQEALTEFWRPLSQSKSYTQYASQSRRVLTSCDLVHIHRSHADPYKLLPQCLARLFRAGLQYPNFLDIKLQQML